MFKFLTAIVARLFGVEQRRPPSRPPHDPEVDVGVREPRRRPPNGGRASVAVMEPEPPGSVEGTGRGSGQSS
jgi:hypothetical protein